MVEVAVWPPTLEQLKSDKDLELSDTKDDASLRLMLDAAVSYVERVRPDLNYDADPTCDDLLDVTAVHVLGTIRLAARWKARGRSPDALVSMGEFGAARIPSFDPDIEQMLGIGRYTSADFA